MKKPTTRTLADLGAGQLAEALVELAKNNEDVARYIARITSDETTNAKRFKTELGKIRRRRRFIPYGESSSYAAHLIALLDDLGASVSDPDTGLSLVADFIRADSAILEACDDSNGSIGDVLRLHARDVFVRYAQNAPDKALVGQLVRELVSQDEYGVRYPLLEVASTYLPDDELRQLAVQFWNDAETARATEPEGDGPNKVLSFLRAGNREFRLVEAVARQLKDAELFERARRESDPRLGTAAKADIAAVWLAADDPKTALAWLNEIKADDHFLSFERDDLLRAIHEQLGNREELERLAWKRFREGRSESALEELLRVIGTHKREEVMAGEARLILTSESFRPYDAIFLLECGLLDEAESYVVARHSRVDGQFWEQLAPLAKALRRLGLHLGATVAYRALLDAILERGYSRAYRHGARYLHQLDELAALTAEWNGLVQHVSYRQALREGHGRKSSFWAFYDALK